MCYERPVRRAPRYEYGCSNLGVRHSYFRFFVFIGPDFIFVLMTDPFITRDPMIERMFMNTDICFAQIFFLAQLGNRMFIVIIKPLRTNFV